MTHTPGPWEYDAAEVRAADGTIIVDAEDGILRNEDGILIAAAPTILAALQSMVNVARDIVGAYADVAGTDSEPGWIEDLRTAAEDGVRAIYDAEKTTKRFALVPEEREKECHHIHAPYEGQMPTTGLRRCSMCGERFTPEEYSRTMKKRATGK